MSIVASKSFGPTDSVAATKTQVGSAFNNYAEAMTITKIVVGKGNVVNALSNAGLIAVEVKGVDGPFEYAYGNGTGGAGGAVGGDGPNGPAEPIDARIPVPPSAEIKVYVTDLNVAKDVTVSLGFSKGNLGKTRSYGQASTGGVTVADTEETMGAQTMVANGTIKQIRFAGSGIVDAKAGSGILRVAIGGYPYDLEFAVGNGPGGDLDGGPQWADVIDKLDIKVVQNQVVTPYIKSAEVMTTPYYSIAVA